MRSRRHRRIVRHTVIVWAAAALVCGCAGESREYRTPLKAVMVALPLRNLRIGLLDVLVVPTMVEAERTALVAFPDEFMFLRRPSPTVADQPVLGLAERGGTVSSPRHVTDQRMMTPNPVGLSLTEIFVLALREAGLQVERYSSLASATEARVDLLLACVVRERRVVIEDVPSWSPNIGSLEASAQLVTTARRPSGWTSTRSLSTAVRITPVLVPFDDGGVNAMLPLGEAHAQGARTALTQVYYHLAMDLAHSLEADLTTP